MSEVKKASKRHCWSDRTPADAYESGFESGALWAFYRTKAFLNAESLFLAIGHGDEEHQAWLKEKLNQWFEAKFYLAVEVTLKEESL